MRRQHSIVDFTFEEEERPGVATVILEERPGRRRRQLTTTDFPLRGTVSPSSPPLSIRWRRGDVPSSLSLSANWRSCHVTATLEEEEG